jgi:hypothetical protein
LPHLTTWSTSYPSKLLFLIIAGRSQFNDGADGLGLSIFFILGIIMTFLGLTILIYEYMRKASLSIELLQYILAYLGYGRGRATDVDDLILNTLGVMIGYQIFDRILIRLHFLSRSQMHNRLE